MWVCTFKFDVQGSVHLHLRQIPQGYHDPCDLPWPHFGAKVLRCGPSHSIPDHPNIVSAFVHWVRLFSGAEPAPEAHIEAQKTIEFEVRGLTTSETLKRQADFGVPASCRPRFSERYCICMLGLVTQHIGQGSLGRDVILVVSECQSTVVFACVSYCIRVICIVYH